MSKQICSGSGKLKFKHMVIYTLNLPQSYVRYPARLIDFHYYSGPNTEDNTKCRVKIFMFFMSYEFLTDARIRFKI